MSDVFTPIEEDLAHLSISPLNCIWVFQLAQGDRVGKREDDRTRIQSSHFFNDSLIECPFSGRQAQQRRRLNVFDNFNEILKRGPLIVSTSKVCRFV